MATINYTLEVNIEAGFVKVEWAGLSAGDVGQAFECGGLEFVSAQAIGSGSASFQGSNELTPTNFAAIVGNMSFGDLNGLDHVGVTAAAIRPNLASGSASFAALLRNRR